MTECSSTDPPAVTVYITSHNYGRFLPEAIESVLRQGRGDWELIVTDDGSGDDSATIARAYAERHPGRIQVVVNGERQGLRRCANEALRLARGRYFMRLDADDYLDESALEVLAGYLDRHPECGLVFPNWTYVSEEGGFLGVERRRLLGREVRVLDLPPHGACTMVRRRVIKAVGGYDPVHDSQDGHELWLKILHRYPVGNVETPLFFYRQHGASLSRDEDRLLAARQRIKRAEVERHRGEVEPRVVAIVPARNRGGKLEGRLLEPLAGQPLLDYTLRAATGEGLCESVFVTTDDPAVQEHCADWPGVQAYLRDESLSAPRARLAAVVADAVRALEEGHGIFPDVLVVLSVHAPLRQPEHIRETVDTLRLYEVDQVISVYEDLDLHFQHGPDGLAALNPGALQELRFEREALLVDNGAVHALWRDALDPTDLHAGRLGHIVMPRDRSLQLKTPADWDLAERLLGGEEPARGGGGSGWRSSSSNL